MISIPLFMSDREAKKKLAINQSQLDSLVKSGQVRVEIADDGTSQVRYHREDIERLKKRRKHSSFKKRFQPFQPINIIRK